MQSLGEHPLVPSLPEMIHRNLSSLRHALTQMGKASGVRRAGWQWEAERMIREHNRLVRLNKKVRSSL